MINWLGHPAHVPIHIDGPWPFVTRRSFEIDGRRLIWRSREHRKGLSIKARALDADIPPFWQSVSYNWAIGAVFALGAFLFVMAAVLSLIPRYVWHVPALSINAIFFVGSIPFTVAAYLQHFQSANVPEFTLEPRDRARRNIALIGWHPGSVGWLSTVTQLAGTFAFNINTLNALLDPSRWYVQDVSIWLPNMTGSILFLVSGYLAFIEVGHRYWSWRPALLSWWIVFINLIGCIAFMTAAILAFVPDGHEVTWIGTLSVVHTLVGAACFFLGAVLTCLESRLAAS